MSGVNRDIEIANIQREIKTSPKAGRRFGFYSAVFDYNKDNLRGKIILDVGAGKRSESASELGIEEENDDEFAQKAEMFGAKVVRLDPKYADPEGKPEDKQDAVVGVVQNLPFADDTFDETIASYSIFWIFTGREDAILEMIRVTKPGGKIKIHPSDDWKISNYQEKFNGLPFNVSVIPEKAPVGIGLGSTLVIEKNQSISLRNGSVWLMKLYLLFGRYPLN